VARRDDGFTAMTGLGSVLVWTLAVLVVALIVAVMPSSRALAATLIFRCVKEGQTVLTDKPCDGSSASTSPAPSAATPQPGGPDVSAPMSIVGDWSGQVQYQGMQNGVQIPEAHSVVSSMVSLTADGKVTGTSADNGCKLLGVWSPDVIPQRVNLDVTLSGCRFEGLNRRYSGSLTASSRDASEQLALLANELLVPGKPFRQFDVRATLRR